MASSCGSLSRSHYELTESARALFKRTFKITEEEEDCKDEDDDGDDDDKEIDDGEIDKGDASLSEDAEDGYAESEEKSG